MSLRRTRRKRNIKRLWHIRTHPKTKRKDRNPYKMLMKLVKLGEEVNEGNHRHFRAFAWVWEKGGEKEHSHIHCAIYAKSDMRMLAVKKYFWKQSELSEPDTDFGDAGFEYIINKSKEDVIEGPWVYGEPPSQGKRTDIHIIEDLIDSREIPNEYILYKHHRWPPNLYRYFGKRIKVIHSKDRRDWPCKLILIQGKAGIGKTSFLKDVMKVQKKGYYRLPPPTRSGNKSNTLWWTGYAGERKVYFNNFFSSSMPMTTFIDIVDQCETKVHLKFGGDAVQLLADEFVITTTLEIDEFYPGMVNNKHYPELMRRLRSADRYRITYFNKKTGEMKVDRTLGKPVKMVPIKVTYKDLGHVQQPEDLSGSDSEDLDDEIEMEEIPKDQWPIFGPVTPNVIQKDGKTVYLPVEID